jgi:SEL1 protein
MYTLSTTSSYHISDPPETYIYDISPVSGCLAAISSDDSLRFFDPTNLDAGPVNSVRRVNADVTCMEVLGSGDCGEGSIICTAGRDGKVVMLDPRTGGKVGEVASGEFLFLAVYRF